MRIGAERVDNITSQNFPGHYPGEDHTWDKDEFRDRLQIKFHKNEPFDAVFSLVGVDASLANAFRRILLSEIPTLAFEDVFVSQNTSIIQDEVLAHRLGLVPIKGSQSSMRWMTWRPSRGEVDESTRSTDYNTVQASLRVECKWKEGGEKRFAEGETDPDELYENAHVYASNIEFETIGQQGKTQFSQANGPLGMVNPDILVAKLRPGQELDIFMHAVKGVGADHAKFSPVATASYRLLPTINILEPITGPAAKRFASCFPEGVISVEDGPQGEQAVVNDTFKDTVTREVLRHEEFKDKVKLGRQRDHFIFSVESTGQLNSDDLFIDSVKALKQKCFRLQACLQDLKEYG